MVLVGARLGQRQEKTIWAGLKQFLEAREGVPPGRQDV